MTLYKDRMKNLDETSADDGMMDTTSDVIIIDGVNTRTSEKTIINKLFKKDHYIREVAIYIHSVDILHRWLILKVYFISQNEQMIHFPVLFKK